MGYEMKLNLPLSSKEIYDTSLHSLVLPQNWINARPDFTSIESNYENTASCVTPQHKLTFRYKLGRYSLST